MPTPFPFVSGAVLTASNLNSISELPTRTLTGSGAAVAADSYSRVILNGSSITYTINTSTFSAGQVVEIYNANSTTATIAAGAGVTLNGAAGLTLAQYQTAELYAVSATSFVLWKSASPSALVRVSTTSAFSGATTVSVNDVFSSTYTNYLILLDNLAAASGTALTMRLRVGGADNTTTNYAWGGQPVNYSTSGTTGESSGGTGVNTSWRLLGSIGSGNKKGSVTLWINNPQTSTATTYQAIGNNDDAAFRVSGQFDQTTSFTGFSLIGGSNISGNVTVYGIEKGS